ncbi:hypothetical protein [Dokdonia sp. Hel_I_53]|uniref:hypothetical protein n=1 Tax=Dokdonia sp. Hel_I_53 TaxID=1566287 RepID=UPI00119B93DB|nr:hypothetical protein [Dokdonia sp. Hel_I_53]TVZ51846.1 hypothetical protein OD90_1005 [Dokdonia sp. Hel_I_53]
MKTNFRLFIILFFIVQALQAQTTREEKRASRLEERAHRIERRDSISRIPVGSYMSLSIVSPITPFPRINMGYTQGINSHWSAGGSIGVGFQGLPFTNSDIEDYSLYEIRPEVLYFIGKGEKFTNYIGLELFYINSKETHLNNSFKPINDANGTVELIRYDSASYQRIKSGFLFNFGEYTRLSDKLMLRLNFGLGMRFKDNSYSDVENPSFSEFRSDAWSIIGNPNPRRNEGLSKGFEFNMDFRLVYKLN